MYVDPRHLMQLATIIDAGGFTEAAARLGTTQPALSRTIMELEKRLGEMLFIRRRRPLQPTPIGLMLAEQGRAISSATAKASERIEQFRDGQEGSIRIGGPPYFMDAMVSGTIADFQSVNPGVRIDQINGYTVDLIALARSAQIDIAICPIDLMSHDLDLEFTPLIESRNIIACRHDHPLVSELHITAEMLISFPWIAPPPNSPLLSDLKSALLSMGADRIQISYSATTLASVINHLKRSECLTVLPHSVVFSLREMGDIATLPLELDHPKRFIGLLRSNLVAKTPAIERFSDFLVTSFKDTQDLIRRHENVVIWGR